MNLSKSAAGADFSVQQLPVKAIQELVIGSSGRSLIGRFNREWCNLRKRYAILIIMASLIAVAQPGYGQRVPVIEPPQLDNAANPPALRQTQTPAPRITERQALDLARGQVNGNVLRISLVGQGNALRYQIRMENEGKIFTVFVNANTGAVSGG